jgi:Bacteriophage HK97-gp10, putative tail-component
MAMARVKVENHFDLFHRDARQAVERALGKTAGHAVAAARKETGRYNIGRITGSIHAGRAKRTGEHTLSIELTYGDWRGNLFEFGTYQKKGALKRGGKDPEGPSRGVKRVGSLKKGTRTAKDELVPNIERSMGRWRA